MSKLNDLTGQRFGRLVVLRRADDYVAPSGQRHVAWECMCDCGKEIAVMAGNLTRGKTKSCGCLHDEVRVTATEKHGGCHKGSFERLYNIWCGMRQRCGNPNHPAYKDYGGRGITVTPEWDSYKAFRNWALSSGYADDLSIDRINNDLGYYPGNCRWANSEEQSNNQRSNINLTFNGETRSLSQWAKRLGIPAQTLYYRITKYGWTVDRALNTPAGRMTA